MLNRLSSTNIAHQAENEHGLDLREAIGFLWRQWMFIASILVATLAIAAIYIFTQTPRYTSTALVLLETQREKTAKDDSFLTDVNLDYSMIESQLAILRSTVFLQRVVEKLGLVSGTDEASKASSMTAAVGALRGAMTVGRAGQGYVIGINVTDTDPARAARFANAVADAYVVEKLDARFEAVKRASGWLSDRLIELRKQLRESEEAVANFRSEHGFVQASTNVTLNQQQLAELNAKVVAARSEVAEKRARLDLLASVEQKGGNILDLPDLVGELSTAIATLRQQETAASQKEAELMARYNDRHPLVVNVRAERRDLQRSIAAEVQRTAAKIRNDYELAKTRSAAMERTLQEVTGQSGADGMTAISLRELERTATVNKTMYEDFLQRAQVAKEQSTFEARESRVITPALPAGTPSYPRTTQFMALSLVVGLFLGISGAVAKDKLSGGFATPRQIEDMLEVPLLASVNVMNKEDLVVKGSPTKLPYYPQVSPLSRYSEAIRMLRTGVQMTDVDNPPRIVQVTSTVPNEGKTTIALSLAVSAANSGLQVLFIDADLRHTSGSNFFGLVKQQGLVDVLLGTATIKDVSKFDKIGKLWVMPAGTKTRNPADLLGSNRMKSMLDQCRETFDMIVIDSPPLGPVIDPVILSHLVDKVVYVVRWASTSRELVQQSLLRLPGEKVAGTVFNLINERAAQKYGRYAYQYYYGPRAYKKYYES
jgi:succinoglycan biosynthesis transport protein ExoP